MRGDRVPRQQVRIPCPVSDCKEMIKPTLNMCRQHWFSLPKPMRDLHMQVFHEYKDAAAARLSSPKRFRMATQSLRDSLSRTAEVAAQSAL